MFPIVAEIRAQASQPQRSARSTYRHDPQKLCSGSPQGSCPYSSMIRSSVGWFSLPTKFRTRRAEVMLDRVRHGD
jgi:hypothetical protein